MDHTIALIRRAHEGDENARAQLVEENTGLIWCVVKRFYGRGTEAEDLFQIGSIGLLKAIDKFDLGYDVKFSTYAVPMITGEIKRFLRDDGMLKVSRSLKEIAYKAYQAKEALTEKLGREPLLEEIAEETGVEKEADRNRRRAWNFPGAGIADGEKDPENHAGTRKRIKGCMFSGKTGILFPI